MKSCSTALPEMEQLISNLLVTPFRGTEVEIYIKISMDFDGVFGMKTISVLVFESNTKCSNIYPR